MTRLRLALLCSLALLLFTLPGVADGQTQVFLPVLYKGWSPPSPRGAALAYPVCGDVEALEATWYYDWSLASECPDLSAEFVPMVWSVSRAYYLDGLSPDGWLLGPNEPNYRGQAVATPEEVAAVWPLLEATGRRLATPAVSACEADWDTNCLDALWLEKWAEACRGCRYEAVAVHWFGCDVEALLTYLDRRKAQFPDKQLWLTEWSCSPLWHQYDARYPTPERFMATALPEVRRRVDREAWFATRVYDYPYFRPLVTDDGLTELGRIYTRLEP